MKKLIKHELFAIEDMVHMIRECKNDMKQIEDNMRYEDKISIDCQNIVNEKEINYICKRLEKAISNIKEIMEEFNN